MYADAAGIWHERFHADVVHAADGQSDGNGGEQPAVETGEFGPAVLEQIHRSPGCGDGNDQ